MSVSDLIQLLLLIATTLGTIFSVIISVRTLKQNSKMIEESSRPYIMIYKDVINVNSPVEYLVIKNFGSSGATINKISCNKEQFKKMNDKSIKNRDPFKYLKNSFIAPNQSFKIPIKTMDSNVNQITFKLQYSSQDRTYNEVYKINLNQEKGITFLKQHQPNNEIKVISNAIQELISRFS